MKPTSQSILVAAAMAAGLSVFLGCGGGGDVSGGTGNGGGGGTTPTAHVAFIASKTSGQIGVFNINTTSGALTQLGGTLNTQTAPFAVAVSPSGKYVYVSNTGSNSVSAYGWNASTGVFSFINTYTTGASPEGLAVDTSGKFLYVADYDANGISAFTINSDGSLTAIDANTGTGAIDPFPAGTHPVSVAVDPGGNFLYVTNYGDSTIQMYTINATTGALTADGSAITTTGLPGGLCAERRGSYVYVTDQSNNLVRGYAVDRTHSTLTYLGNIASGVLPAGLVAHPSQDRAFVVNQTGNSVTAYTIAAATGALAFPSGSLVNVGAQANPSMAAVDGADGILVVTNFSSNSVSSYGINSDGSLLHLKDSTALTGVQGIAIY